VDLESMNKLLLGRWKTKKVYIKEHRVKMPSSDHRYAWWEFREDGTVSYKAGPERLESPYAVLPDNKLKRGDDSYEIVELDDKKLVLSIWGQGVHLIHEFERVAKK